MFTLKKAMRVLEGEPWTIATEDGEGWIFYHDGKVLHDGTRYGLTLDDLLCRECVRVYERGERKYIFDEDRRRRPWMELEAGLAFIVAGREYGTI